jgi:hypothetical protein
MKLTENNQRAINAIAVVIEKKLEVMYNALNRNKTTSRGIATNYNNDISEEQKTQILKEIDDLYHLLEKFCEKYNIPKQNNSLKRELNTDATFLWVDLVNSTGKSLKGFGVLDTEILKDYDFYINQMIEKTNKIAHITN